MKTADIKRFALVLSKQAELEGMKADNAEREARNEAPAYPGDAFMEVANDLEEIAYKYDNQL